MCGRVSLCAVVLGLVLQTSARVPASRAGSPNVTARAWQNLPGDFYFPEAELEAVASRPASAILFSGGGSRSFTVTTGYMAALLELGLLDSTRYVSGVSGGSWATVLYAFSNTTNATLLMGNTTFPQNLTADALATLPAGCARRAAVDKDMLTRILEEYLGGSKSEYAWVQAVNDVFMAPFGVPDDVFMAWNASRAAELKGANPVLQNMTIATPRPGAPYFVWSSTVLGPQDDSPFKDNLRTYTLLEMTPGYLGEAYTQNVTYTSHKGVTDTVMVGGLVEAVAFGGDAPEAGLGTVGQASLSIPLVAKKISPVMVAGASSMAPADVLATILGPTIAKDLTLRFPYWTPALARPPTTSMIVGDGGCMENLHLLGMLQRRIQRIVMFCNFEVVLSSAYNASAAPPTHDDIDDDIPAFFGVLIDNPDHPMYDINRNQVFRREDFPRLVDALQASQAAGSGAIATMNLTTVENKWWGLPGGLNVTITFVYWARALEWEAQLPSDVRKEIVPSKHPEDPASRPTSGTFKHFPNIPTDVFQYKVQVASALANLAGWMVHRHADELRATLEGA